LLQFLHKFESLSMFCRVVNAVGDWTRVEKYIKYLCSKLMAGCWATSSCCFYYFFCVSGPLVKSSHVLIHSNFINFSAGFVMQFAFSGIRHLQLLSKRKARRETS
jgi:hypothetical protein